MSKYQVEVHGPRSERIRIDLCNTEQQMQNMTVLQLKEKIVEKLPECAGDEEWEMVFENKRLHGDYTLLSQYGIQHMSEIRMIQRLSGGGERQPCPSQPCPSQPPPLCLVM